MCGIKKVGDGGKRIASQWWNDETKQVAEKKKGINSLQKRNFQPWEEYWIQLY